MSERYPLYTGSNAWEINPGVQVPLNATFWPRNWEQGFRVGFFRLGIMGREPEDEQIASGIFFGRAYFNHAFCRLVAERMPGTCAHDFDEQYLGVKAGEMSPPELSGAERWGWRLRALPAMGWAKLAVARRVRREHDHIAAARARLLGGLAEVSTPELLRRLREAEHLGFIGSATNMQIVYMCSMSHAILGNLCAELPPPPGLDAEHGADEGARHTAWVAALTTGLGTIDSAQVALDLAALAAHIEADRELRKFFSAPAEDVAAALAAGKQPALAAELHELAERHGHRCLAEQDLTSKNWSMDLTQPIRRIQETMRSGLDAPAILPRQRAQREEAERAALAHQRGRQLWLFRFILDSDQQLLELRERQKGDLIWAIDVFRRLVLELSARLVAEGALGKVEDVHFLSVEELYSEPQPDWRLRVARRREACYRLRTVRPPEVVDGRPVLPPEASGDEEAEELTGIGGSPGVARGAARLVADPLLAEALPGEILVAETTDVGWVPLFLNAAAVVCDLGGDLSHTVICAREFGIPCVVNTKRATTTFHTGDLLEVDGYTGVVRRLARASNSTS